MKKEQFKHNLKKIKRIKEEERFSNTMKEIEKRIEIIKQLNKRI